MPIKEIEQTLRQNVAVSYANYLVKSYQMRHINTLYNEPGATYFLSTPLKRHIAAQLFLAHARNAPITINRLASSLSASRTQVKQILNETVDAGWVQRARDGYMLTDDEAVIYRLSTSNVSARVMQELRDTSSDLVALMDHAHRKSDDLEQECRRDVATAYANTELNRHQWRQRHRKDDNAADWFMATEARRHMSSALYLAWRLNQPASKSEIAARLMISRVSASALIDHCVGQGWVERAGNGYQFTDEQALRYEKATPAMLMKVSTKLTECIRKLQKLTKIMHSHRPLTRKKRSPMIDGKEIING